MLKWNTLFYVKTLLPVSYNLIFRKGHGIVSTNRKQSQILQIPNMYLENTSSIKAASTAQMSTEVVAQSERSKEVKKNQYRKVL